MFLDYKNVILNFKPPYLVCLSLGSLIPALWASEVRSYFRWFKCNKFWGKLGLG